MLELRALRVGVAGMLFSLAPYGCFLAACPIVPEWRSWTLSEKTMVVRASRVAVRLRCRGARHEAVRQPRGGADSPPLITD